MFKPLLQHSRQFKFKQLSVVFLFVSEITHAELHFMSVGECCFMDCQLYQFHYINLEKTWTEAQQYCREKHTDLVTVTNMKDMKRLINISAKVKSEAWIGLTSKPEFIRTWFWSLSGVGFNESETKWKTGEPSDNEIENCGYLIETPKWGDVSCCTTRYFLCYKGENP
uniref:C-type lectin domain-containing protein n=1 Tax=Poecilia latipinna TaxID=48699 RepID=A0A3B3W001_9TELE